MSEVPQTNAARPDSWIDKVILFSLKNKLVVAMLILLVDHSPKIMSGECYSLMTKMVVENRKATTVHDLLQRTNDFYENYYYREIYGNEVKMDLFRAFLISWGVLLSLD